MEAYTGFAGVYDMFMDNIPYDKWGEYLISLLKKYRVTDGIIAELGCGTGNITEILAAAGYDMIGIDNSQDMLNEAVSKKYTSGHDILYLLQDMRQFELYGTVAAVVSICDSLNYITEYDELVEVFRLVNNYLDPSGIFIFDMNTIHKYETIGEGVIAENRESGSFIWENSYNPETRLNKYELTVFVEDESGKFDKYSECHVQKGYSIDEIRRAISDAGMEFVAAFDAFGENSVRADSDRMYIIAREKGKEQLCQII